MVKVAYASRTGHVQTIVENLGLKDVLRIKKGDEKIEGEYVIFTYTTGIGKTPKAVDAFLKNNPGVVAVVGSGSMSITHRRTFNFAAENIAKAYNVPIIAKVDGVGTAEDMEKIRAGLEKL